MDNFLINDKYSINGMWFLPGIENEMYPGVLEYNPKRSKSILKLWTNNKVIIDLLKEANTLNGISEGRLITLIQTQCNSIQKSMLTVYEFSIYGSVIFGKHYTNVDEIMIDDIFYRFSGLADLCKYHKSDGDFENDEINISYKKPKDIILFQSDHLTQKLSHSFSTIPFGRKTEIKAIEYIEFIYNEPCSLKKMLENIDIINNFLIYNLNSDSHPISITAKVGVELIQVLNPFYSKYELTEDSSWMASSRLFEIGDKNFINFYQSWYSFYSEKKNIMDKYFLLLRRYKYFIEEEFIIKTQLFEEIHRKTVYFEQSKDNIVEHNARIESIMETCPNEHKKWLKKKLVYSNEITFSKRLKDTVSKMDYFFKSNLSISNKDMSRIIYKIYTTRNFMTHGSKEAEKDAVRNPQSLIILNNILKIIIDYIIFTNLDFTDEMIKKSIFCKPTFYSMLHNSNRGCIDWKKLRYTEQ